MQWPKGEEEEGASDASGRWVLTRIANNRIRKTSPLRSGCRWAQCCNNNSRFFRPLVTTIHVGNEANFRLTLLLDRVDASSPNALDYIFYSSPWRPSFIQTWVKMTASIVLHSYSTPSFLLGDMDTNWSTKSEVVATGQYSEAIRFVWHVDNNFKVEIYWPSCASNGHMVNVLMHEVPPSLVRRALVRPLNYVCHPFDARTRRTVPGQARDLALTWWAASDCHLSTFWNPNL